MIYLGALVLGFTSGLRAMTPIAGILILRGGIGAILGAVAAIGEYIADASPKIPSRTALPSIVVRPVSGAIVGWVFASAHGGSAILGASLGVIGAFAGTYGGHAARLAAISRIGPLPAAVCEDLVAIALAAVVLLALIPAWRPAFEVFSSGIKSLSRRSLVL